MFRTSVSKQNTHAGDSGDGGVGARENSKMSVPEVHRSYANTNFDLSIPTHWPIYFCIEAKKVLLEIVDYDITPETQG